MNQKKVLALLLSLCLIVSMTVPVFAAGSRGVSMASGIAASAESVSDATGTYTAVASSSKVGDLAESGETYYYLSGGVYYAVTFTKGTFGLFVKRTSYTLTANGSRIATLYATSTLSSARVTLYTKEEPVSTSNSGTLTLVEDETTVSEGTTLRASTYALTYNTEGTAAGGTQRQLGDKRTLPTTSGSVQTGLLTDAQGNFLKLNDNEISSTTEIDEATEWTITRTASGSYTIESAGVYLTYTTTGWYNRPDQLKTASNPKEWSYSDSNGFYASGLFGNTYPITSNATLDNNTTSAVALYNFTTYESTGEPVLKYFPVTLYNYDKTSINNATHQVELDGDLGDTWNGIYFSDGSPAAESYSEEIALEDGTYIIQNARAAANSVGSWLVGNTSGITSTTNESDATQWTVKSNGDGTYTLNSTNGYMTIGSGQDGEKTATTASNIEIVGYTGGTYMGCVQLKSGSYYLCQWGGTQATIYGGYDVNNDGGNAFFFYKVTDSGTEKVTFTTTDSLAFARWNWWNKNDSTTVSIGSGKTTQKFGQYTYSGLVESTLTANKDITFTKPDGGIFNSDATVKDIYTGVEMPFVYVNGTYTFDASQNGVYFYADSTQGSTVAQSNGRLYYNESNPQSNNTDYADGSKTVWMPFNSTQSINGEGSCDYHFGMRTTIPFTMTANGKMNPNDNTSEDITFSFSGDDDVWIFIDGQLVIDLGGIHNRLDATINFATNTWSISASNSIANYVPVADFNGAEISGTLFNDGDTTGTLNQTRETFAATDSHELTIFYLERGAGSSNCKIQFNLPMKDTLSVKKLVRDTDSEGQALDADTLAQINNRTFGFTLYKDGEVVANMNYSLLNENGQYISTPATDANGHFELMNGQTAKFVGEINNNSYYVIEDKDANADDFWLPPVWAYTAEVAQGATSVESTVDGQSMIVTANGSTEAEDSIVFTCTNIWKYQDNTSISAVDDRIVIDYGLPVVIDVLANDTVSNGTKSIESVTGAQYGTATIENGKITYQLNRQLTGVEVLTYTAKATAVAEEYNKTADAKIYIIPATSMYYEENFSDLVTFSDGWSDVGTAQTDPQEPGVVGTVGDSPYGSDAAYLNDSGDSNGSSKYVNTTNGSATFSYTFTGTGTSFFARTSGSTAVIGVEVTDENGGQVAYQNRNTIYTSVDGTDVGTLYNIPVYTVDGLGYGTYTVTVTVLKAVSALKYGAEFYLDGIRVISPLDSADENAAVASAAYATDGEANMTVVTLRQKLLADYAHEDENGDLVWDGEGFVIFTDTNGKIQYAEEYKSNGPKEEVYLNNGQSVTFSLYDWDPNTNKIYLGIKAPVGSGSVSINGNTLSINNAADCYYDISGYAHITTMEGGVKVATFEIKATSSLISVTNIKVTGNVEFTIIGGEDIYEEET